MLIVPLGKNRMFLLNNNKNTKKMFFFLNFKYCITIRLSTLTYRCTLLISFFSNNYLSQSINEVGRS